VPLAGVSAKVGPLVYHESENLLEEAQTLSLRIGEREKEEKEKKRKRERRNRARGGEQRREKRKKGGILLEATSNFKFLQKRFCFGDLKNACQKCIGAGGEGWMLEEVCTRENRKIRFHVLALICKMKSKK
jgi:hypothetical protein